MNTEANRTTLSAVMNALSQGDGRPFVDAMAEDFTWHMIGSTPWSGTFRGKSEVRGKLMKHLFDQFATRYRNHATQILADGDIVVVECRGDVTTRRGLAYNNTYCWIIRMAGGQMRHLTEYMDTALVNEALEPPGWA
jgi:uncharacterized protein